MTDTEATGAPEPSEAEDWQRQRYEVLPLLDRARILVRATEHTASLGQRVTPEHAAAVRALTEAAEVLVSVIEGLEWSDVDPGSSGPPLIGAAGNAVAALSALVVDLCYPGPIEPDPVGRASRTLGIAERLLSETW